MKLVILKRISQALFFLVFTYVLWSTTYPLRGVIRPKVLFHADPLIVLFTSLAGRILVPGIALSVFMLAATFVFGRYFCGWVCPLGSAIDAVGAVCRKKDALTDTANRLARRVKYGILGFVAVWALGGAQVAWVFDPIVLMARFISLNVIPTVTLAVDFVFIVLIRDLHLDLLRDPYQALKASLLGVKVFYFFHSGVIFLYFALAAGTVCVMRRFWCRSLCPLGGLYALIARFSRLRRVVVKCNQCMYCKGDCRMGAIRDDLGTVGGECILCMDCVYDCPQHGIRFSWGSSRERPEPSVRSGSRDDGISRRTFLIFLCSLPFFLGAVKRIVRGGPRPVIRPPAALREDDFVGRCVRCGNCMKVCITNGLQPALFQSGIGGIWTPHLVPEIGYCEYNCTLCGSVCPTGAIRRLTVDEKHATRLGVAAIDQEICIPWSKNEQCIVCEEHCPVPEKAIKLATVSRNGTDILVPSIDQELCVGCGICQNKCPVRPVRAVRITGL